MDALSAPLLFFWVNVQAPKPRDISYAQEEAVRMLKSISPTGEEGIGIVVMREGWVIQELIEATMDIAPGGYLIVPGDKDLLLFYFKMQEWKLMPITFGGNHIFRKPRPHERSA